MEATEMCLMVVLSFVLFLDRFCLYSSTVLGQQLLAFIDV